MRRMWCPLPQIRVVSHKIADTSVLYRNLACWGTSGYLMWGALQRCIACLASRLRHGLIGGIVPHRPANEGANLLLTASARLAAFPNPIASRRRK